MKQFNVVICETAGTLAANVVAFFNNDNDIDLIVCNNAKDTLENIRSREINGIILDVEFERSKEISVACKEKGIVVVLVSKRMGDEIEGSLNSMMYDLCLYKPYSFLELRTQLLKFMIRQAVSVKLNSGSRNID